MTNESTCFAAALGDLGHHETDNILRKCNLNAFIDWDYVDIFLKNRQDSPLDEANDMPGAIFRTSYNSSLYTLINKAYGEGLDTIVMIPAKVEGDNGDATIQEKLTIREYMNSHRGLTDLDATHYLLVATPLSFTIKCAPQTFPHATRHVLPTLFQERNDAADDFDFVADEAFPAKRFDKLSRRFLPQHALVLPVSLLDLNFCCYIPTVLTALYRRFATLRLFFRIVEDNVYPNHQIALHLLQQPPESILPLRSVPLDRLDITLVEQALTCPSASISYNYERLETFGDTVLKYLTSYYLFLLHPTLDEGGLTEKKKGLISNVSLVRCRNAYILEKSCFQNQLFMDVKKIRALTGLSFKMKADLCESMLGAFYACWGENGAHVFLSWLDPQYASLIIDAMKCIEDKTYLRTPVQFTHYLEQVKEEQEALSMLPSPDDPNVPSSSSSHSHLPPSAVDYASHFSKATVPPLPPHFLGYRFRHRHLFATALTHTSATKRPTGSHFERLEFLGDAALDLVISALLYDSSAHLDPGQMSTLRAHIAGNATYAFLGVACGLHAMLIYGSSKVHDDIASYCKALEDEVRCRNSASMNVLLADPWVRNQNFPDSMADAFEAVMGALFLDLKGNILAFSQWVRPVIQPVVEAHVIPGNPMAFGERHPQTDLQELLQAKGCRSGSIIIDSGNWKYVWHDKLLAERGMTSEDKLDHRWLAKDALEEITTIPDIWEFCDCNDFEAPRAVV